MRYSLAFKESQVKKVLPPSGRSINEVATEAGISFQTLHNWLNKAKEGTLGKGNTVSGKGRSPREKLNLVIEFRTIPNEKIGQWLREKGLHSEHITQYEQELRDMVELVGSINGICSDVNCVLEPISKASAHYFGSICLKPC